MSGLVEQRNQILFFEEDSYLFSNWSAHAVEVFGKLFPTSEHAYHYKKFDEQYPEIAELVRAAKSPYLCKEMTRHDGISEKCRTDWDSVKLSIMREVVRAKFDQHEEVRNTLKNTANKEIIENSPVDYYWGCGKDGTGQNWLGKIWMEIRREKFEQ